jgi:hypothetical protein
MRYDRHGTMTVVTDDVDLDGGGFDLEALRLPFTTGDGKEEWVHYPYAVTGARSSGTADLANTVARSPLSIPSPGNDLAGAVGAIR